MEKILYKVSGEREDSNFCVPLCGSGTILNILQRLRDEGMYEVEAAIRYDTGDLKYAGLNLSTMYSFGSLEFRMHEGTTNVGDIQTWLGITTEVMNAGMSNMTTGDMVDAFWDHPVKTFKEFFSSDINISDELLEEYIIDGCESASLIGE